ncbi:MAG: amidase domain-containing protein [Actinomycetota bacterium]|nr:amidase domain-containing protein [Actinomycetota bacterium]
MKYAKTVRIVLVLCSLVMVLVPAANAYAAYNATGAASYAESWVSNSQTLRNPEFPSFSSDCTNFTSQALNWGGGKAELYGSSEDTKWYCDKTWYGTFQYSNSWSVASYFYNLWMAQGATSLGSWYAPSSNSNSALSKGVLLSYDWDNNGSKDHMGIVTNTGTDPTSPSYSGNLQCQHSTDRYRAIWHLRPYNTYRTTTRITAFRPN